MKKTCVALFLALTLLLASVGAWASEEHPLPSFATFGDAVAAAGETPITGGSDTYMAVIVEQDGRYYRVITTLDGRAAELNEAIFSTEDLDVAFENYYDYVWTLPVTSVEAFETEPMPQEELDALAGKTIGELEEEGYTSTSYGTAGEPDLISFLMAYGLYEYEFVVDADFDLFEQKQESDELGTLVVRSARFSGASPLAIDLRYHMDGTVEPEEDVFADFGWMTEFYAAIEAMQNGEDVDMEALLQTLAEEYPEVADLLPMLLESYQLTDQTPQAE